MQIVLFLTLLLSTSLFSSEIDSTLASMEPLCLSKDVAQIDLTLRSSEKGKGEYQLRYLCPTKSPRDMTECQSCKKPAEPLAQLESKLSGEFCPDKQPGGGCLAVGSSARCLVESVNGMKNSVVSNIDMIKHTPQMLKALATKVGEGYALVGVASWHGLKKMVGADVSTTQAILDMAYEDNEKIYDFMDNWDERSKQMVEGLYKGISMLAKEHYGCQKWDSVKREKCLVPMESWDCARCEDKMGVVCGVVGHIPAELAVIYATALTGTAVGNVSMKVAQATTKLLQSGEYSSKMVAAVEKFSKITVGGAKATQASAAPSKTIQSILEMKRVIEKSRAVLKTIAVVKTLTAPVRAGWSVINAPIIASFEAGIARGHKVTAGLFADKSLASALAAGKALDMAMFEKMSRDQHMVWAMKNAEAFKMLKSDQLLYAQFSKNPKLFHFVLNKDGKGDALLKLMKTSSQKEKADLVRLLSDIEKLPADEMSRMLPKVEAIINSCK